MIEVLTSSYLVILILITIATSVMVEAVSTEVTAIVAKKMIWLYTNAVLGSGASRFFIARDNA